MCRVARALVVGALFAAGCGESRDAGPPPLELVELAIEPAAAPREPPVLVAGEDARIGLRIRGGRPPYRVALQSAPLTAELEVAPSAPTATGAEAAARAPIARDVDSGAYTVSVTVTDAAGTRVSAERSIDIVGANSPQLPAPASPPWVTVEDAAGRRRIDLLRGEQVALRGRIATPGDYRLALSDPQGAAITSTAGSSPDGAVELPFQIPRLARPGRYGLAMTAGDSVARTSFRVAGEPFAPVTKLAIDGLAIYAGGDGRARRKARLLRGESISIEARVAGARRELLGAIRLRDRHTELVADVTLGVAQPRSVAPDARLFLAGTWTVPAALPPGRYTLEVEVQVQDGDDVSTVYREVKVE